MKTRTMIATGLCLMMSLPGIGCSGGTSSSSGGSGFTEAQGLAAMQDMFNALAATPLLGSVGTATALKVEAAGLRAASLNGTPAVLPVESANDAPYGSGTAIPSYTYNCPSGGTIVVGGTYTSSTTSQTVNITETITNCNDGTITMSGSNITIGGTNAIISQLFPTIFSDTEDVTGTITVGNNTCPVSVFVSSTVNEATNVVVGGNSSVGLSGTVCNVVVSGPL